MVAGCPVQRRSAGQRGYRPNIKVDQQFGTGSGDAFARAMFKSKFRSQALAQVLRASTHD
jgi:hypothetical protein